MRTLAITGPRSARRVVERFRAHTRLSGNGFDQISMASLDHVRDAIHAVRPDFLLLFGGDGTLNRHLDLVVGARLPLLVVPTGSGNDFAMTHGAKTAATALDIWRDVCAGNVKITSVDLGQVQCAEAAPRYFSCCCNFGLDADGASRADRLPSWLKSRKGYFIGGAIAILRFHPQHLKISADDREIDEVGWLVSVSNTPTYGGGLKIAPHAQTDDGLLDITFVHGIPRAKLIEHFPKILSGQHVGLSGVQVFATKRLQVASEGRLPVWADGEFMGHTPAEVVIAPQIMRVLRPYSV